MKRDDAWLQLVLDKIWDNYFDDVPQDNDVRITFGRRAKRRLGSISLDGKDKRVSLITINGIFRKPGIPEYIVEATIVHELTHYAHGFNSPLTQAKAHPHAGGVMRKEFADRGLLDLYLQQKKWLKANWPAVIAAEFPAVRRSHSSQAVTMKVPKPFWFIGD